MAENDDIVKSGRELYSKEFETDKHGAAIDRWGDGEEAERALGKVTISLEEMEVKIEEDPGFARRFVTGEGTYTDSGKKAEPALYQCQNKIISQLGYIGTAIFAILGLICLGISINTNAWRVEHYDKAGPMGNYWSKFHLGLVRSIRIQKFQRHDRTLVETTNPALSYDEMLNSTYCQIKPHIPLWEGIRVIDGAAMISAANSGDESNDEFENHDTHAAILTGTEGISLDEGNEKEKIVAIPVNDKYSTLSENFKGHRLLRSSYPVGSRISQEELENRSDDLSKSVVRMEEEGVPGRDKIHQDVDGYSKDNQNTEKPSDRQDLTMSSTVLSDMERIRLEIETAWISPLRGIFGLSVNAVERARNKVDLIGQVRGLYVDMAPEAVGDLSMNGISSRQHILGGTIFQVQCRDLKFVKRGGKIGLILLLCGMSVLFLNLVALMLAAWQKRYPYYILKQLFGLISLILIIVGLSYWGVMTDRAMCLDNTGQNVVCSLGWSSIVAIAGLVCVLVSECSYYLARWAESDKCII